MEANKYGEKLDITRRMLLSKMGIAAIYVPLVGLIGCDDKSNSSSTTETTITEEETSDATTSIEWAAGGTELITLDYPDDTLFETASVCSLLLTESTTEGPCYLGVNEREDISDGQVGLPMMLF